MSKKITATLENWYVGTVHVDAKEFIIWGEMHGDSEGRFIDGTHVHTSGVSMNQHSDLRQGYVVQTRNSTYLLGKPAS